MEAATRPGGHAEQGTHGRPEAGGE